MTGFPKGILFRKSIPKFIKHKKNIKPPTTPTYTTIYIRMSNMLIRIVGSSVIFFTSYN